MRRAGLPHARRGPLLHGSEGPHRARPLPGRVGGDARPTSRSRRPLRASGSRSASRIASASACRRSSRSSIYTHPETGFPLAICDGRYHTVHAHGRLSGRVGEVARAPQLEGARDRRRRAHGRGRDRDVQRGLRLGRGARLEPVAVDARRVRRQVRRRGSRSRSAVDGPRGASSAAPTSSSRSRRRAEPIVRTSGSRPARTSRRSAPTRAATRSSTRASSSGRGSSSTTSASAARTARSTCRSRRA